MGSVFSGDVLRMRPFRDSSKIKMRTANGMAGNQCTSRMLRVPKPLLIGIQYANHPTRMSSVPIPKSITLFLIPCTVIDSQRVLQTNKPAICPTTIEEKNAPCACFSASQAISDEAMLTHCLYPLTFAPNSVSPTSEG